MKHSFWNSAVLAETLKSLLMGTCDLHFLNCPNLENVATLESCREGRSIGIPV